MPRAEINGTGLYYEVQGRGEPLILIQGFAGGLIAWYFQVRAFKKHFRVITFDARGIGKSRVSTVPYTVPLMAEDILGLMDRLKIARAHILGLSLGGLVAQTIAINHPERVKKLVLCSTLPGTDRKYATPEADRLQEYTLTNIDVNRAMDLFIALAFNKVFYRFILRFLSRGRWVSEYTGYFKQMRLMENYSTLDRLQEIKAPTLVITGSGDRLLSYHSSEVIAGKIPNARLVIVKGGSHAFFLEMRGRFNREVLQFLRQA